MREVNVERDCSAVAGLFSWSEDFTWNAEDVRKNILRWPAEKPMYRLVADSDGEVLGYGRMCQTAANPRGAFLGELIVFPEYQRRGIGRRLLNELESYAAKNGAMCVVVFAHAHHAFGRTAGERLGYEARTLFYQYVVDPREFDPSPFAPLLSKLEGEGYRVVPFGSLEACEATDRAYHSAMERSDLDTPFIDYFGIMDYDTYRRVMMEAQWFDRSGVFVALLDDEFVGMTTINKGSVDFNGEMFIEYTGVLQEHRGKGLATAMKVRALEYAKSIGGTMVRTENNDANPAMRTVNKKLGFVESPGMWMMVKEL